MKPLHSTSRNPRDALPVLVVAFVGCFVVTATVGELAAGLDQHGTSAYASGEALVKLRPVRDGGAGKASAAPSGSALAARLLTGAVHKSTLTKDGWHVLGLPPELSVAQALAELRTRPEVEFAEPNFRYTMLRPITGSGAGAAENQSEAQAPEVSGIEASDPLFPRLYGLERIGAPAAWQQTTGSKTVIIAVFDTGVDYTHPDLAENMWRNPDEVPGNGIDDDENGFVDDVFGVNVYNETGDPMDPDGHGTHVAGTIGARANNALGIAGINWNVQILAVAMARENDGVLAGDVVRGLDYLTELKQQGVNLVAVNHSWGGPWISRAIFEAFARLSASGVANVCAAGNSRRDCGAVPNFPNQLQLPGFIRVAASDRDDHLAQFTDFGVRAVDLAAPGVNIWSLLPGGRFSSWSGTSMAAPHVTGALGLLFALDPELTAERAKLLLAQTSEPLPDFDRDRLRGGRMDVGRAVQWLMNGTPLRPSAAEQSFPPLQVSCTSRNRDGFEANDASWGPSLTDDGRFVAFASRATNLVSADANGLADIFLHDRVSRTTVRVSQTADGTEANGTNSAPVITGDGQFVAFASVATNLSPGDTNVARDVLLWNRQTGAIDCLSQPEPNQPRGSSDLPSISQDGRRVVFQSFGPLIAVDSNDNMDVYLFDRERGGLRCVSQTPNGNASRGAATEPMISAEGRFVAFTSTAADLVPDDLNGMADIFVHDLETGVTERVSVSSVGQAADRPSKRPRISADGRYVAFQSSARNLDPAANGIDAMVYVHDRETRRTWLASKSPDGQPLKGKVWLDAVSGDGRFIVFRSGSLLLPPGVGSALVRLYAYDRLADDVVALSYSDAGEPLTGFPEAFEIPDQGALDSAISADGRYAATSTGGWNFALGDGNAVSDVFVIDRGAAPFDLAVSYGTGDAEIGRGLLGVNLPQFLTRRLSEPLSTRFQFRVINRGDSRAVPSVRVEIAPAEALFEWPLKIGLANQEPRQLPALAPGESAIFWATLPPPTADSMTRVRVAVGFQGPTGGFVPTDRVTALVTKPLQAPGFELVSVAQDGNPLPRHAIRPSLSRDGLKLVFETDAHGVVRSDTNFSRDIFLRDREAALNSAVSATRVGTLADADSFGGQISSDGRFVVFSSYAGNLGPDMNYAADVFVKNLENGLVELASRRGSTFGNYESGARSRSRISGDGRFVMFQSYATNLAPGDTNDRGDIFLLDRTNRNVSLLSRSPEGALGNGNSHQPVFSSSGRYAAFVSAADNLTSRTDVNGMQDVFLWKAGENAIELVSEDQSGAAAMGHTDLVSMSDDGRFIALHSDAPNFEGGSRDGQPHYYLLDRAARKFHPAAGWLPAGSSPWQLTDFTVSHDGNWLVLGSRRQIQQSGLARLETRVELVHRSSGTRQLLAEGVRGRGVVSDGFTEVLVNSAATGEGRFVVFAGEGREGREFVSQLYLFARPQEFSPALQVTVTGIDRNGGMHLQWNSDPARTYSVEHTHAIDAPFRPLIGPLIGQSLTTAVYIPPLSAGPTSFFRIRAEIP